MNSRTSSNNDRHYNLTQYYNAVEDEQHYMNEYATLLHRYNEFIVNGNAMFTRMEQTLRENLSRTLVRQSFYYHHSNELPPRVSPATGLNSVPVPVPVPAAAAPPRERRPTRQPPRDNNIPHLPAGREIHNGIENLFSFLYTAPSALRANPPGGAPTNEQINQATLNTVFSHIVSPVNATCPISRDEFNDESEITMIRGCNHIFNRSSLREWFIRHSTCPLCRGDIRDYRPANLSIDSVGENHVTFSYDLPMNYENNQIYHDIVNTVNGLTNQNQYRYDDGDDMPEVD
jgi:hypothetical protein